MEVFEQEAELVAVDRSVAVNVVLVEELFDEEQAWTLIEWADRVADVMPANTLWLKILLDTDPETRTVEISTSDHELSQALGTALREMISKS